jgi:hypothetical protein
LHPYTHVIDGETARILVQMDKESFRLGDACLAQIAEQPVPIEGRSLIPSVGRLLARRHPSLRLPDEGVHTVESERALGMVVRTSAAPDAWRRPGGGGRSGAES